MFDRNHFRNPAWLRRTRCFHVRFLLTALAAALERQSLLLFGWLLFATPVVAQAQFDYTITNGTVTITKYTGSGGLVTIPDRISGLPVTAIGDDAFWGNTDLTGVTIPKSVTNIGRAAFYSCASLTNVTIPNSVTFIGEEALGYCTSLTEINVEANNPAYNSVSGALPARTRPPSSSIRGAKSAPIRSQTASP
jgi:hypothetical protein